MHTALVTDNRYCAQVPPLPFFSDFAFDLDIQYRFMADVAFDRDRVRAALKAKRVTHEDFAKAIGLTHKSAVPKILSGERDVKYSEAVRIYEYLELSPEGAIGLQSVPMIGMASAGNWREAVAHSPGGRMMIPAGIAGPRAFAIEIFGDSMNLLIRDGGWIVVDPDQKSLKDGKCYLIQNDEHEATVKCYRGRPDRFEPMSDNELHQPFLVSECDFIVLGRVVWTGARL
jgi:repressor LexA